MKDKSFENWGKWDGTELDRDEEEEKNYKKQHDIWRNMYDKEQADYYRNKSVEYAYGDKRDGGHPDSKQFKDFEEALFSSSRTKIAKIVCMCSFFALLFSSLSIAILDN